MSDPGASLADAPPARFENIGWTVGNHCNARCGHCYSWMVRKDSREFLTPDDVDRIVAQLVRLGVKTVNLGGNEPVYTHGPDLRRTLLPYIVRRLHEAQLPVGLTTNGVSFTWMADHHPDELKLINDIDFSLDSPYEAEHDHNRGTRLYRLVIAAIQRARAMGIDCSVIACGMKENFTPDYLSAWLALTKMLGCEFRINTLKPVEQSLLAQMPDARQFYAGFSFLMNRSKCITLGESCVTAFTETGTEGCPCGTSSFRINAKTADGRVPISPCVYMHDFKAGDLLSDDILDIVRSPEFRTFAQRRHQIPSACRESGCSFLERCRGGCSARSYLVHGHLDGKDPYCPQEHLDTHGRPELPHRPEIGVDHGIRVHDNYLCTWIGEVSPDYEHPNLTSLDQYLYHPGDGGDPRHMSGCRQVKPGEAEGLSLAPTAVGTSGRSAD